MSPLAPIPHKRRVDVVYAALREAMLCGVLPPGQPLSVPELARQLGVSRSPVREAVLRLAAGGLAQETARRGVEVARLGPVEALHLLEVCKLLEIAAVRAASELSSKADLENLSKTLVTQASAVRNERLNEYQAAALAFHHELGRLSCNPELEKLIGSLSDRCALALGQKALEPPLPELHLTDRRYLLEALRRRDGSGAAAALERLFARLRSTLEPPQPSPQPTRLHRPKGLQLARAGAGLEGGLQ